jgi:hypothetical protein
MTHTSAQRLEARLPEHRHDASHAGHMTHASARMRTVREVGTVIAQDRPPCKLARRDSCLAAASVSPARNAGPRHGNDVKRGSGAGRPIVRR